MSIFKKESASVKLAAFSHPEHAYGIEPIEIGDFDIALTIKLPAISFTLTAAYNEHGVCEAGSWKTVIELDSEVDIEVDLQRDAELGDGEDTAKRLWSHTLHVYPIPLELLCFPLDIPEIDSSSSAATMGVRSLSTSTLQYMVSTAEDPVSLSSSAIDIMVSMTEISMTTSGLNSSTWSIHDISGRAVRTEHRYWVSISWLANSII